MTITELKTQEYTGGKERRILYIHQGQRDIYMGNVRLRPLEESPFTLLSGIERC